MFFFPNIKTVAKIQAFLSLHVFFWIPSDIEVQSLCLSTSDVDQQSWSRGKNGSKREIFSRSEKWVPFFPLRDVYGRKSSVGGFKWR